MCFLRYWRYRQLLTCSLLRDLFFNMSWPSPVLKRFWRQLTIVCQGTVSSSVCRVSSCTSCLFTRFQTFTFWTPTTVCNNCQILVKHFFDNWGFHVTPSQPFLFCLSNCLQFQHQFSVFNKWFVFGGREVTTHYIVHTSNIIKKKTLSR